MVIFEIIITLMLWSWLMNKLFTNKNPKTSQQQEARENKGAAKHQAWQTLDLTEPWSGHIPGLSKGDK